ncbi:MAG: hypothetical protein CM1200mP41_17720 [Gammaproteobacteria bacterium]|nr:MAG: hypothetical protein CM1200mP41_17720 [Gammaproteobacteria bacterium]
MAQKAGFGITISHRSGETEDTTIADLAGAQPGRADQDGIPVSFRTGGEIQSTSRNRARTWWASQLPGACCTGGGGGPGPPVRKV